MEKTQNIWGSLAVGYFFLAGTAAVVGIIVALQTLMPGEGVPIAWDAYMSTNFIALVVALILAGAGGMMLLAELTQKPRFPRVFTNPKSLMTLGAFALSGFMGFTFLYALFLLNILPPMLAVFRVPVAVILILFAAVLAAYPALEMAEARGRGFWGFGLVPLFLVNAFVCGAGVLTVLGFDLAMTLFIGIIINIVVLTGYMWSADLSGRPDSRRGYDLLMKGHLKGVFVGGAVAAGLIAPAVILWFSPALAGILALAGGACFRYAFMKAGVRVELPGERNENYSDEEISVLSYRLEARWREKTNYTSGR